MTKPGHEAPLLDNSNRADMASHSDESQLRIGQEIVETNETESVDVPAETPKASSGIQLTENEEGKVDRLIDQGIDRGTALFYRTTGAKARRVVGHHHASEAARSAGRASEQRADEELAREARLRDGALEVMRSTLPQKPEGESEATAESK